MKIYHHLLLGSLSQKLFDNWLEQLAKTILDDNEMFSAVDDNGKSTSYIYNGDYWEPVDLVGIRNIVANYFYDDEYRHAYDLLSSKVVNDTANLVTALMDRRKYEDTFDQSDSLNIANEVVAKVWGQGFVNVRRLKNSDNVGAYLMAYLSDIDLNNLKGKRVDSDAPKKIVKGGRLGLYPIGMQIYRHSRNGIVQPIKLKGRKKDIKQKYQIDVLPEYYRSFDVKHHEDGETFTIETEYYSRKKAKLEKALQKIKNYSEK